MANYKLTAKAAEDFARLYQFGIDVFGQERADQYTEYMELRFLYIASNPLHYAIANNIAEGCRRCVCGSHSIYYRQQATHVEIIRILNKEDPTKLSLGSS